MNNILKATHIGILPIGDKRLDVAVLQNGQRIINQSSIFKALDRPSRGNARVINIPVFMDAKNLQPFITEDLRGVINKIQYQDKEGKILEGYDATILPLVSDLYLSARAAGVIKKPNQLASAQQAEILVRSLAKVGIIALVDEATGYQYDREKYELQAILQLFISSEILEWQKTFHLGFYKEIFRLWKVPFTPHNIKRKPPFIGMLTNELIYKNLPKGSFVLQKLKEKTPKTEAGNYKVRLFQSLTPIGKEELKKVLYSVESLAVISENKKIFRRLVQDRYGQRTFQFPNWEEIEEKKEPMKLSSFDNKLTGLLSVPPMPKEKK